MEERESECRLQREKVERAYNKKIEKKHQHEAQTAK